MFKSHVYTIIMKVEREGNNRQVFFFSAFLLRNVLKLQEVICEEVAYPSSYTETVYRSMVALVLFIVRTKLNSLH